MSRIKNWFKKKDRNEDRKKSVNQTFKASTGNQSRKNNLDYQALGYESPGTKGECDLIIGLDFGTSGTKVVIQAPDLPGSPANAIDFGPLAHRSMPYVIPTKGWIGPNGIFSLRESTGYHSVMDIKTELFAISEYPLSEMGPTRQGYSPEETAACYLALVLRYSREWFLMEKSNLLGHFERFYWGVNLGVPSPCIEDNDEHRSFIRVGRAAWRLSTLPEGLISIERARNELMNAEDQEDWDNDDDACDLEIIPEIAAGAVGYALSNLRREGVHVMIDIGASTIDVCSFELKGQKMGDQYCLFIANVKPLGTSRLYLNMIPEAAKYRRSNPKELRKLYDPLSTKVDSLKKVFPSAVIYQNHLHKTEEVLREDLLYAIKKVIWPTCIKRIPEAPVWEHRNYLPILLVGGGSKQVFFRSAIERLDAWSKKNCCNSGIQLRPVPVPEKLVQLRDKEEDYQLLSVSWGLSHRAIDIGEIIPADQIPDSNPYQVLDREKLYVSKDQV